MLREQRSVSEPFTLLGKRLVFMDWSFIRPAEFGWFSHTGENITVTGNVSPDEALFRSKDRPYGIRLEAQKPERCGPVLQPERPWEQTAVHIHTLIRDEGIYRAWGYCWDHPIRQDLALVGCHFHVLESNDGFNWKRPKVGLVDYLGNKDNNLLPNTAGLQGGTVFVDPSADPCERYKLIGTGYVSLSQFDEFKKQRPDAWQEWAVREDIRNDSYSHMEHDFSKGYVVALIGAVSRDGCDWKFLDMPLVVEHSDNQPVAYYDTILQKYVCYTRKWYGGLDPVPTEPRNPLAFISLRRSIGRSETSDFRRFPISRTILTPGPEVGPSEVYYLNGRTTIPGALDHHLMLTSVWDTSHDQTRLLLYTSADGILWHLVPGGSIVDTASWGQFDGGCLFASPNMVELPDGSFVMPYQGHNIPHKYPRGQWESRTAYIRWPQGRVVALKADALAEFSTYAFLPPTRQMTLNVRTRRAGSVKVELVDYLSRTPLPGRKFEDCHPIMGDHSKAVVRWGDSCDLGVQPGQPIFLRFKMDMSEIFMIEFC